MEVDQILIYVYQTCIYTGFYCMNDVCVGLEGCIILWADVAVNLATCIHVLCMCTWYRSGHFGLTNYNVCVLDYL